MACHQLLDFARRTPLRRLNFSLLLLLFSAPVFAQTHDGSAEKLLEVRDLYNQNNWEAVVNAASSQLTPSTELLFYRGLSLAHLEKWDEARAAFAAGAQLAPADARFPEELAGIAYHRKKFAEAKRELRHALTLDSDDSYAADFLASIYFQEGNLEAALKYWNRVAKPRLNNLILDPQPASRPLILDRAFSFSPGQIWTRDDFLSSRARLAALDLYPGMFFELKPHEDNSFDLAFQAAERDGWGNNRWAALLSFFRDLPYQAVDPEFYNLGHSGVNWTSTYRWDEQKRRVFTELAAPLFQNPSLRYRLYFDAHNENWNLTNTFLPASPALARLNLGKAVAGTELRFIENGRWQWTAGAEYSFREFRNLYGISPAAGPFFTNGSSLALRSSVQRWLIRHPERRFTLESLGSGEIGTFFKNPLGRYARIEGALNAHWFPEARGEDYETQISLRSGGTSGNVPFDDLFTLGFDRDTSLWLRGHPGLQQGQKGNAPLGRDYVLLNSETDKIVYRNGLVTLKLGPFLDTGRVYDPSPYFGSREWLWDAGAQAKIKVVGRFQIVLGYGKDLRSGRNSFFTAVTN